MLDIRPFDPHLASLTEWAAVHTFHEALTGELNPDDPKPDPRDIERQLRKEWPLWETRYWCAWNGLEVAGSIGATVRRAGTDDCADHAPYVFVWGGVSAPHRRRGIGTALLSVLLEFMRGSSRRIATIETVSDDGRAFLLAAGAVEKHRQRERRVALNTVDWRSMAAWEAAAVPEGSSLRWERHVHRMPHDRVVTLLPQFDILADDVPSGELEGPRLRSDLATWLAMYAEFDRHGGDHMMVLLMDGEKVAALCETIWDARFPKRIVQNLTAVAPQWRRRGLGKGVKGAMMRMVRERHPDVSFVATWNADTNAAIIDLNRRLGFVDHRHTVTFQLDREALETYVMRMDGRTRPAPN